MWRDGVLRARSVIGPALYEQKMVSRFELEDGLRAWYLHTCQERIDPDKRRYFKRRQEARRWFKELCDNQHFKKVLAVLRREQEPLNRAILIVSWLKDARQMVNNQSIPYKKAGRLSALDKVDGEGGLQVRLSPELDDRLPHGIIKRSTTIAGLLDFLGLPSTTKEVAAALHRYARASVIPARPEGAIEITRLLHSWEAPTRED